MTSDRLREEALKQFNKKTFNTGHIKGEAMKKIIEELKIHQIELEIQNDELKQAQVELQVLKERYEYLYNHAPFGYVTLSNTGIIEQANHTFCEMIQKNYSSIIKTPLVDLLHLDDKTVFLSRFISLFKKPDHKIIEARLKKSDKTFFYAELQGVSRPASEQNLNKDVLVSIVDISKRKQAEAEQQRLIDELQDALDNVNTLQGLLPMCSFCKKIRKDDGYWEQIEEYIRANSNALCSHGLCPECAEKHYPDIYKKLKESGKIDDKT